MTPEEFPQYISHLFGEEGVIASMEGGRHLREQQDYAVDVAKSLLHVPQGESKRHIAAIEASGGMGKTLAYLVCACLHFSFFGRRTVIATNTTVLRDDIINKEMGKLHHIYEACGLTLPCIRVRRGRNSYLSAIWLKEHGGEWPAFSQFFQERKTYNLTAWYDEFVSLPEGLFLDGPDGVSLRDGEKSPAMDEYRQNCQDAREADIMLTTHALTVLNGVTFGRFFGEGFRHLIIDEAEHLLDACTMRNQTISLKGLDDDFPEGKPVTKKMRALFRKLSPMPYTFKTSSEAKAVDKKLEDLFREYLEVISEGKDSSWYEGDKVKKFLHAFTTSHGIYEAVYHTVKETRKKDKIVDWTIHEVDRKPVNSLLGVYYGYDSTIMTSAYLNEPGKKDFRDFQKQFGIHDSNIFHKSIHSVKSYGTTDWVFHQGDMDLYEDAEDDTKVMREEYIDHLADMANATMVAPTTSRVVVLCTSYADLNRLGDKLEQMGHVTYRQEKGSQVASFKDKFFQEDRFFLLVVSWEGLDFLGITHLMITKIPFPAPNVVLNATNQNIKNGDSQKHLHSNRSVDIADMKRKLGQGFARAIRSANHHATIWICDPRFPLPSQVARKMGHNIQDKHGLLNCIPSRFLESSQQGRVWKEGKMENER